MAEQAWLSNLSVAFRSLQSLELDYQTSLETSLEGFEQEFKWLDDFADETCRIFTTKHSRLEPPPKTPCLHRKGQKRTRPQVKKVVEGEDADGGGSVLPKSVPTKLKFELKSPEETTKSDELAETTSNRPVRRCRAASKAVYTEIDEDAAPKRSTRQSRKPTNTKSAEAKRTEKTAENTKENKENQSPVLNIAAAAKLEADSDDTCQAKRSKTCTSAVSQEKSEQKSPSVRDRAKAYEAMLKCSSKSPVKPLRTGTPGSSSKKVPVVSNKDSLKKEETNVKRSASKRKSRSSETLTRRSLRRQSRRSSHHKSNRSQRHSSKSSSKKSSQGTGTRQIRTRLRLKKQKPDQDMDTTESEQSAEPDGNTSSASQELKNTLPSSTHSLQPEMQSTETSEKVDDGDADMFDDEDETAGKVPGGAHSQSSVLNETEIVVTEVFEIQGKDQPARLREFEMLQTKTTPVRQVLKHQASKASTLKGGPDNQGSSSDQGFNEGEEESGPDSSDESEPKKDETFTKSNNETNATNGVGMSTRTRTRAKQEESENKNTAKTGQRTNKDSGCETEAIEKVGITNSTFTKDEASPEAVGRSTRTRTRAQKEKESNACEARTEDVGRSTRTRQRKQEESSASSINTKPTGAVPMEAEQTASELPQRSTRSRFCKLTDANKLAVCGSDDEVIAGSPAMGGTPKSSLRVGKKRLVEERGLSPRPKRSCVGDQSGVSTDSPLSTSSPKKNAGASVLVADEARDMLMSPKPSIRPYKFNSAQKKISGCLNRTPGFGQNTSKLYSFLSNTPTCRTNGVLTTFLKKNNTPKETVQVLQEQKRKRLLEKDTRDQERLKKAAELKKRRIEEQRRQREEKERRVAEAREMRLRLEQEQKERLNKKLEDKASLKEKMLEERMKEEREKQKQRIRKQMEADARRKQEEEERLKKLLEQEEEAKMQEEFMQRKKEFEEAERQRQIAEEKKKQEERLAELEQKRHEERARLKQLEEEKEKERERIRLEKEQKLAQERAERERLEREKREEKEKRIKEELEKLKAMEKERLRRQEEEAQRQQQEEAQQKELLQMINKHNQSLNKQTSSTSILNSTQTASNTSVNKVNSYDITPVKIKLPSKSKNPENYDIEDKGSDDSTDDEEAPKKRIPEWAMGINLNTALIRQHMNPPDLDTIFRPDCIEPPDLTVLFPGRKKRRYVERTSSAIWTSPVMRH